jgi:hypothetical protein
MYEAIKKKLAETHMEWLSAQPEGGWNLALSNAYQAQRDFARKAALAFEELAHCYYEELDPHEAVSALAALEAAATGGGG